MLASEIATAPEETCRNRPHASIAHPMREIALRDIQDAAGSIYDLVVRTPLVHVDLPESMGSGLDGSRVFLKLENLQPIGSFKIRGAHNVVRQLRHAEMQDGVWTVSAG